MKRRFFSLKNTHSPCLANLGSGSDKIHVSNLNVKRDESKLGNIGNLFNRKK